MIQPATNTPCAHCGLDCPDLSFAVGDRPFCCQGCRLVFQLLQENGLKHYYQMESNPGVRPPDQVKADAFRHLDDPAVKSRLLDFTDGRLSRITLRLPAIHCVACIWLLENLFRLSPGVSRSIVNFERREAAITYDETKISLAELAALLASLGYPPELNLESMAGGKKRSADRSHFLKLGVAGFAFGNIMLLSLPSYFGLDPEWGPAFGTFFGRISMLLALPVFFYSASDYLKSVPAFFRKKILTVDFPIGIGMIALFVQSAYDVLTASGEGYFDTLAGLTFFMLLGRTFQRKTFGAISFERDYRSYFPLSVTRIEPGGEKPAPLCNLVPGDRVLLRNGELVPADCRLESGSALIDYSFVTGESHPVERSPGEMLFAGGRQAGGLIRAQIMKPVSQSYLTSLWNEAAFTKPDDRSLHSMTNVFSRYFTVVLFIIAIAATAWWARTDPGMAARVFTSILIVACPCALALSAPFTLGTAIRLLGRAGIFVKHPVTLESLARANHMVFDKTGTITDRQAARVEFTGRDLEGKDLQALLALSRRSTHPHCQAIARYCLAHGAVLGNTDDEIREFSEIPGKGIQGTIDGAVYRIGSSAWFSSLGLEVSVIGEGPESESHLAINESFLGTFRMENQFRSGLANMLSGLRKLGLKLSMVSGDKPRERKEVEALFGDGAELRFEQTPFEKLSYIQALQSTGAKVAMIGDGLNDAGALKQSDTGLAVTEDTATFSPASDLILSAASVQHLDNVIAFSRGAVKIVWASFLISCLYNVIGLAWAISGRLSPLFAAILMPMSSITVVAFAVAACFTLAKRHHIQTEIARAPTPK